MSAPRRQPPLGLPRPRAGWISLAWFLLGVCAILAALPSLQRDLRRAAELDMLSWLKGAGEALRPLVEQSERQRLDAAVRLPQRREGTSGQKVPSRYASQAQLWLVSAAEGEPGLIVPVSTEVEAPTSLRDFSRLQAGIVAARGGVTRPLAVVDGPAGPQVVAYLRLAGTGYGVSTSMKPDLLYGQVKARLLTIAAVAATLLACACAGLFRLIAAPAGPPAAAAAAGAAAGPAAALATVASPAPTAASTPRLEAGLQRILYHTATLEHEGKADPRLREHLAEIRETARQGLADLHAESPADKR